MTGATANGKAGEIAPAVSRIDQMVAELTGELEQAKEQRDLIAQQLAEHDQLVSRLDGAIKSLAGPKPRQPRGEGAPKSHKSSSREMRQLVESTMAEIDGPASVTDIHERIPHRHDSMVRNAVYDLRDESRVRIVDTGGTRGAKRYALMPEVQAEYAAS